MSRRWRKWRGVEKHMKHCASYFPCVQWCCSVLSLEVGAGEHVCEGTPWVSWLCTPCGKVLFSLLIFLHALGCVLETWLEAGPPSSLRTGLAAFTAQVLFMSKCSIHSASVLGGMAEQKHLKIWMRTGIMGILCSSFLLYCGLQRENNSPVVA